MRRVLGCGEGHLLSTTQLGYTHQAASASTFSGMFACTFTNIDGELAPTTHPTTAPALTKRKNGMHPGTRGRGRGREDDAGAEIRGQTFRPARLQFPNPPCSSSEICESSGKMALILSLKS